MKNDRDDVAALKNRIKVLEEQNSRLNNIIFKAPIPIFVVDKDHTITHFNKALEELSGLTAADMVGTRQQWKAFYASERPVMADLIIDRSSDDQIVEHYGPKYNRSSKDRERFAATDFFKDLGDDGKWLYFTASTFADKDGSIAGAVETLQDVTEEKIAERKTRELSRIYRQILEFVPYPIVVYDEKGLVSYVNPSFSTTFGWSLDELKGRQVPFVPQGLEEETSEMLDRFRKEKSLTRYETQRLTRDGRVLDVVLWAETHSRFKTGETQTFVILRDITEEKRLEANNRTIMRISAVLPEYPELEDLMTYISKEVKALLNTEGAVVLLYDEIREEFFFEGAAYDNSDTEKRTRRVRFPADSLLAGEILKTGEYALVNDVKKLKNKYPDRDTKLGYTTRSLLEVPIKSEGRIIGVLCAINKKQNRFDYNDMELMTMIAGTCAISIENARFSEALKEAYMDVAAMNRAKGKAINHLSHELKTPVAILSGSVQILKKKLESAPGLNADATLNRIERNLNRVVDIQDEVADIMEGKTYSSQTLLMKMFEACQDELETLILQNLDEADAEAAIRKMIDDKFGPRALNFRMIDFKSFFEALHKRLAPEFEFRPVDIRIDFDEDLPSVFLPEEILKKVVTGLLKNAIENTPDFGRIEISFKNRGNGVEFRIRDFGVGIETENQKRIFEGFFTTQETLLYSTKTPFSFDAGGKGADLLRMKIFSDRHGFSLGMESSRCRFLIENKEAVCPGNIKACRFCQTQEDCLGSGFSVFTVFFPAEKK